MPELSLQQIDLITRDIVREEITFSHLPLDLIDHICCDIEDEMNRGTDFASAYRRVKLKIGKRRLKEIQEETLYLVDTKYRNMKIIMKISGVAGTIIFGVAASFKIQHWPLAGILMSVGALILSFAFLPSALSVLWKETKNTKKLFLFISAFLTGLLFISGTLFKIQHWPMAGAILLLAALSGIAFFIPALLINRINDKDSRVKRPVYILGASGSVLFMAGMFLKIQHWPLATIFILTGIFLLCFITFPMFTRFTWKEENHISPVFIFLIIGFILIMVPGAMITLNMQNSYQEYYYSNNEQQTALYDYLSGSNNSMVNRYNNSLYYPEMKQLHSKTRGVLAFISNIQEKMAQESGLQPGEPAGISAQINPLITGKKIIYRELTKPFDTNPAKVFLMPGCSTREALNSTMAEYVSYLSGVTSAGDLLKYKKMLDTEKLLPSGKLGKSDMSLMAVLHSLEIMKNGLLTVESCVLNDIVKHR